MAEGLKLVNDLYEYVHSRYPHYGDPYPIVLAIVLALCEPEGEGHELFERLEKLRGGGK